MPMRVCSDGLPLLGWSPSMRVSNPHFPKATLMTNLSSFVRRAWRVRDIVIAAALTLLATAGSTQAQAHDYALGDIKIEHPWSRATPGGTKVAGGFMKITNNGKVTDRLIGGTFIAAGQFEVHETQMKDNVMRMRRLEKGLEIPPGATVELRPGSYHVMFIGLQSGLKEGERIKGTLVFEKAGKVEVEYKIEALGSNPAGAKAGAGHHSGHH